MTTSYDGEPDEEQTSQVEGSTNVLPFQWDWSKATVRGESFWDQRK